VIHEIAGLIADGAIGTVTAVHADFGLAGPFPPGSRLLDPALGGGALLDLGVYPLTMAHLFLGAPDSVSAWASLTPESVDQNTAITLGYASGAIAQLSCSLVGDTPQRASITGTAGRIELGRGFFHPDGYTLWRADAGPEVVRTPVTGVGYGYEATEVHRCLRAGLTESPMVPHAETLAVMATLDAVRAMIGVSYP
jgi:predicted dehydrogenase